ncbi:MAG: hypothetical protein JOY62_02935 [Acidobacteriaceae bacterium]|nr:hypothetical protein [Acidobacteriaceae bacterium]MBV9778906.1 hypothetical protein [Acidobacteriaceae bacterium]
MSAIFLILIFIHDQSFVQSNIGNNPSAQLTSLRASGEQTSTDATARTKIGSPPAKAEQKPNPEPPQQTAKNSADQDKSAETYQPKTGTPSAKNEQKLNPEPPQQIANSADQNKPAETGQPKTGTPPAKAEQKANPEPPQQTPKNSAGQNKTVATPKLDAVFPPVPLTAPGQPLRLSGSDFDEKVSVVLIDPQENEYELKSDQILSATHERVILVATLGVPGKWKVKAKNPGGKFSDPLAFSVGNSQVIEFRSPSFCAFAIVGVLVALLLFAMFWVIRRDLNKAIEKGQWSLGEAISEESAYQPTEIRLKSDVILFGSTSRLIALLGLLGILTTVLGIGYAIMWGLFIHGTVPDLSEVRSFLYGSACLFAPYLANKLAGVFTPSGGAKPTTTAEPAAVSVTGVTPPSPAAAAGTQSLGVTGSGFQSGLLLTLVDPGGGSHAITGADITSVHPTLVTANATLNAPGAWKVSVTNPASAPSGAFNFSVLGPPGIANPEAPITHAAGAQSVTFIGSGFMSGLTVSLTDPANAAVPATVTSVTPTRLTVSATIATAGNNWRMVVTNPGNNPSQPYTFAVT